MLPLQSQLQHIFMLPLQQQQELLVADSKTAVKDWRAENKIKT